jgi:hypothetical protein
MAPATFSSPDSDEWNQAKLIQIYSTSVLNFGRSLGVDVDGHIASCHASYPGLVLRYPDGSLQVRGQAAHHCKQYILHPTCEGELNRLFADPSDYSKKTIMGISLWNSLPCFGSELFQLHSYGEWIAVMEHEGVMVKVKGRGPDLSVASAGNLNIRIGFRRTPKKAAIEAFAAHVAWWADSVRERGIGDELSVSLISSAIEVAGRIAQFQLDASRSGQLTINWLIIALASFCETEQIELIDFTAAREQLSSHASTPHAKLKRYELPSSEAIASETVGESLDSDQVVLVPPYFRLHIDSALDSSSAVINIALDEATNSNEIAIVQDTVEHWRQLGVYGGFGGRGFDDSSSIAYLDDESCLRLTVDFGVSDVDLAIKSLVWLCESWSTSGVVIDEVRIENARHFQ